MFKNEAIRNLFRIPPIVKWPTKAEKASAWKLALKQYKGIKLKFRIYYIT